MARMSYRQMQNLCFDVSDLGLTEVYTMHLKEKSPNKRNTILKMLRWEPALRVMQDRTYIRIFHILRSLGACDQLSLMLNF